jgi:hypothetical protein
MDVAPDLQISVLDEVKAQARVLVPLLAELRRELGEERANAIVYRALRDWSESVHRRIAEAAPGDAWTKLGATMTANVERIGTDVDVEWITQEPGQLEFRVTGCRYADFFRALGEPALGAILLCDADRHAADAIGPEVEFTRRNTIMQGAPYCDFRYRLVKG